MSSCVIPPEQPLAGGGGVHAPPLRESDPFLELDDLMAVVEALCPTWPQRGTFTSAGVMLL